MTDNLAFALATDPDFLRDEREADSLLTPQVPCYICGRAEPDDPACNLVTLDGERRGLCRRCWSRSEDDDVRIPLDYTEDEFENREGQPEFNGAFDRW